MKIYEQELKETLFYYDLVKQKAEEILALYLEDKWEGAECITSLFYSRGNVYIDYETLVNLDVDDTKYYGVIFPIAWFALEGAELVRAIKEYKEKEGI